MSKHTPGPWRAYFHEDYPGQMQIGAGEIGGSGDEFDEWCIAATFGSADGTENGEANASLIVAAPDMLAALKAVRSELDAMSGNWTEGMSNFAQQADVAIAKAEGR